MLTSLILAASLATQVPTLPQSAGYGQGRGASAAQRKLNSQKWDPRKTYYGKHNSKAKSIYEYHLKPSEAVHMMWQMPWYYPRRPR